VWDVDGRKYLDFSAGIAVNALGHADEGVLQVSFVVFAHLWALVVSCGYDYAICWQFVPEKMISKPYSPEHFISFPVIQTVCLSGMVWSH